MAYPNINISQLYIILLLQFHEDIQAAALDAMEKSSKIIRYSFLSQDFSYIDVYATFNEITMVA